MRKVSTRWNVYTFYTLLLSLSSLACEKWCKLTMTFIDENRRAGYVSAEEQLKSVWKSMIEEEERERRGKQSSKFINELSRTPPRLLLLCAKKKSCMLSKKFPPLYCDFQSNLILQWFLPLYRSLPPLSLCLVWEQKITHFNARKKWFGWSCLAVCKSLSLSRVIKNLPFLFSLERLLLCPPLHSISFHNEAFLQTINNSLLYALTYVLILFRTHSFLFTPNTPNIHIFRDLWLLTLCRVRRGERKEREERIKIYIFPSRFYLDHFWDWSACTVNFCLRFILKVLERLSRSLLFRVIFSHEASMLPKIH